MQAPTLSRTQWAVFGAVILAILIWFIWPFVGVIALSALAAWVFYPIYRRLYRRIGAGLAAGLTFFTSLLIIGIPIAVILGLSVIQLTELVAGAGVYISEGSGFAEFVRSLVGAFNAIAAPALPDGGVSAAVVVDFMRNTIPTVLEAALGFLVGAISNVPYAFILALMYVTLFIGFLIHGRKVVTLIREISPLGHDATNYYLVRVGLMANAMVKGQLLIAFVGAVIAAFLLIFLGLGNYFFLMVAIFTFLNLIPLGAGLAVYPIIVIAILAGNVIPGLVILILYTVASNFDVLLRPRIIPKSIQLSASVTMVAALAGIAYFGLIGVVYGPIIAIVILTSIDMYRLRSYKK